MSKIIKLQMKKIAVLGSNGQLGNCIRKIAPDYENSYEFIFTDSQTLDITDEDQVSSFFYDNKPDYCINASAYTAVDLAEKESDKAFAVNADGVGYLAQACVDYKSILIHISTDYVFDGDTNLPYSEDDFTSPTGIYGESKRKGEELALEINPKTIVLRTSWLYSEFNKNFVKTMLNLFSQKDELGIVADQFGQPTNANDLAEAIMDIIKTPNKTFGVFHFSNYPETSWFEFAKKIAEFSNASVQLNPLTTEQYPTPAKRPARSTMSLDKIEEIYRIEPKHWENSLEESVRILTQQ
ncbi:dTDP-4-dehydrorhamnose reductase [Chryseobacterium herbae]|uniref:dTDP-4-dehydrorhamnose reductase n=1 Tax=Chryseobacterium herbae TaxID=2976476 RepID=UPI0035301AA1